MLYEIKIPTDLGESIVEVIILKFKKKLGDQVDQDEPVADIATDKIDSEVSAGEAGIVTRIFCAENDVVPIGTAIMEIETAGNNM